MVAPLTHHPFVSKSQAPGGWNLLQQVAPLTHRAPVTHHRTVVGTCHWWVTGRRPNSLEYQICTAPEPFDTVVTGLYQTTFLLPENGAKRERGKAVAHQADVIWVPRDEWRICRYFNVHHICVFSTWKYFQHWIISNAKVFQPGRRAQRAILWRWAG